MIANSEKGKSRTEWRKDGGRNSDMVEEAAFSPFEDTNEDTSALALKVAHQLDLARQKRPYKKDVVRRFIQRLREDDLQWSSADLVRSLAPVEVDVMNRAVSAYRRGSSPTTIDDLTSTIRDLMDDFSKFDTSEEAEVSNLIAFCVTLHDELLSQRRFLQESRKLRSQYRV